MSVLERAALEASPLADLHTIASELSLDGYRRLRKADLIDAIIARQGGSEAATDEPEESVSEPTETSDSDEASENGTAASRRRRGRRGGRGRSAVREDGDQIEESTDAETEAAANEEGDREEPSIVEGVVELLANGSGFVRVSPPDPSDDDVYISAAQVKRCELVAGDTINGRPASEIADRSRYDDLDAFFPADRFKLASEDETLKAIEFLTPIGRGSRVTIIGGAWAGKSHTLKDLARALAADTSLSLFVALTGVRPEELSDWNATDSSGLPTPAVALSFAASADAQDHAIDLVIDQAKRVATRGGDAVVLIDSLDGLHAHTARKALAAARNLTTNGSLTVIATATKPFGGETTVIALDAALASTGRFPALDLINSGTLRPELLVGEAGAKAIAEARTEAQAL